MKQVYNYSPELPRAYSIGNLNLESPIVWQGVKIYRRLAERKLRKTLPAFSFGTLPGYHLEPVSDKVLPAILYLHGGGFIFPMQPMMARACQYYAKHLSCRIFIPEYCLAPEYPFPIPPKDCLQAYLFLLENYDVLHIDPARIAIVGDSAGGALAASLCQMIRDRGLPIPRLQMLIYPVTDNSLQHKSLREYAKGTWSGKATEHMWNLYLKDGEQGMLPYAAPLQQSSLTGLPPCYVEVCEMDCLRDEGIAYAKKLKSSGVATTLHIVPGAYHGYDMATDTPFVQRELARRIAYIQAHL